MSGSAAPAADADAGDAPPPAVSVAQPPAAPAAQPAAALAAQPAAAFAAQPAAAFAAVLAGLPHAAWLACLETRRVVAANAAAGALFGRPAAQLIGESAEALAGSPEDLAWWQDAACGSAGGLHSETLITGSDGAALHTSRSIGLVVADAQAGDGTVPTHALVMVSDRSAEQRAVDERETLLSELQATLEATADGILVTDPAGRIRAFNRRFAELFGMPLALLQQGDDAGVQAWMADSVLDSQSYAARLQTLERAARVVASDRLQLRAGPLLERVTRPLVSAGRPQGRVWSFRDLTERIAAQQRIESMALHDTLTGLPNRRLLATRIGQAAAAAAKVGGTFAVLVIDLDRFRQVNDSLGQATGDRVLLDVGRRIGGCLRQEDLLARLGGDQFAVLVEPADAAAAEATARRILGVVAEPCNLDGAHFTITCSIGASLGPSQGTTIDDLARHAEAAMRTVKGAGRANYRLHRARAEGDRRWHMRLDHAMRQALVSGRFKLHYQPQVDLATGQIVGAEALLRWRDPELGDMAPGRFIPVAEESGFIVAIGDWVLTQAVRQAARWHQRGLGLPVAVNVSALQFQQAHFVDRVAGALASAGVPPRLLELELTESILVHDVADALARLHALAELGVGLSIDDFGTGYSSLAYLKRLPIGKLKIDRSFIAGLPGDDSDAGIVLAILQMARALGMRVVAEGVETEAQRQFLLAGGCDEFQGWLFAPAMDSLSFEQRLEPASAEPAAGPDGSTARIRLVRG